MVDLGKGDPDITGIYETGREVGENDCIKIEGETRVDTGGVHEGTTLKVTGNWMSKREVSISMQNRIVTQNKSVLETTNRFPYQVSLDIK